MKNPAPHLVVGCLFLLNFASLVLQGHSLSVCDNSASEAIADACYKLDEQIEYALLQDKGNLYRLRKAFFYAPNAHPVLLRVIYNLSFDENATQQVIYCTKDTNAGNELSINKTAIVLGWTSSGVFTVFHPLTINFMQIQVPFVLMKMIYSIFNAIHHEGSGPEAATFLWDGSYHLPTLRLNLHFTNLTCIPSRDMFDSVLSDFNSLLRIYAGKDITGIIQDSGNTHLVGFSLPSSSVSPYHTTAKSDFWLYVVYVLSTFVLYASCITTIFFVVSKSEERGIRSFTKRNPEVLIATIIVIGSFVLVEILAELVMAIVWTVNVKDHRIGLTVFAAAIVYYGPGLISLFKVGMKILYYNKARAQHASNTLDIEAVKTDTVFDCFVWITAYFAYVLLYSFFPAFVLAFAYPTRVITIFAFIATFLVLSIVYLTTYIKKGVTWKRFENVRFIKIIFSIILMMLLLYFFLFIFALLYSLVIGRASVVSSAPLALLSLLPSILISIAAWVMKSTMLNTGNGKSDKNKDRENEIDGKTTKLNKQLKQMDENQASEIIVPAQDEGSCGKIKMANQDGEVIANAVLIQNEGSEEREREEANQNGHGEVIANAMLTQIEESCGREEKEIKEASQDGEITEQKEASCGREEKELEAIA